MGTLSRIDLVAQGLARLPQQFKNKPRIAAFLTAWLDELQSVQDAAIDFYIDRELQKGLATHDILEKFGALVGQGDEGLNDAQFSVLISARIRANRSDGKRQTMIAIASLLVPNATIRVRDYPPAETWIAPQAVPPVPANIIGNDFLFRAIAAGVYLVFVYLPEPPAQTFTFKDIYDHTASDGAKSFADSTTPGTGGFLAGGMSILGGP